MKNLLSRILFLLFVTPWILSLSYTPLPQGFQKKSEVKNIPGIFVWLETTSKKSFDESEMKDGAFVTNWYDINPQKVVKNHAQQNSQEKDLHPIYQLNCINSLPCLSFNGKSSFIETLQKTKSITKELSIFVAIKPTITSQNNEQSYISTTGNWRSGASFTLKQFPEHVVDYQLPNSVDVFSVESIWDKNVYLISLVDNGSTGITYLNGYAGLVTETANPEILNKEIGALTIGAFKNGEEIGRYFKGGIGEIIIFERALKNEEREVVENYLMKKWKINPLKSESIPRMEGCPLPRSSQN